MAGEALTGAQLARANWQALGTGVALRLTDCAALAHARACVELELAAIDRACSRFREDSDLSRVNARAGRPVAVSALLMDALDVAVRAAELTGGDVDPTVGLALELAGYDRDWRRLASARQQTPQPLLTAPAPERAGHRMGWRALAVDRRDRCVRVPAVVRLDLGATAKAWAADRAARAASRAVGCGVLVSIGGDIATCGPAPRGGWCIRVTDDHRSSPAAPGQTVSIHSGGLATSSTTVRRWRHGGRRMHHIIDPRTARPVRSPWRTISVAAGDCTDANIAATAAFVRGERAAEWLRALGLPARLVAGDGRVTTLGDWPAEPSAGRVQP